MNFEWARANTISVTDVNKPGNMAKRASKVSLLLLFNDSFVASDVLFADVVFPIAYAIDYFTQIIFKFFVGYVV